VERSKIIGQIKLQVLRHFVSRARIHDHPHVRDRKSPIVRRSGSLRAPFERLDQAGPSSPRVTISQPASRRILWRFARDFSS
jgi:hypothetical protein